ISLGANSINASSVTLDAYRDITTTTGNLTLGSGVLTLSTSSGTIGSSSNHFTIATSGSDTWTKSKIALSASNGSIFIKTAAEGLLTTLTGVAPTIVFRATETFSLHQTLGNITLTESINLPSAVIYLKASDSNVSNGSINLSNLSITASTVKLDVSNNITSTTGSITASIINLIASSGLIGSSTQPLTIHRSSGTWTSSTLTFTVTPSTRIYLRTSSEGVLTALPSSPPIFSLIQTVGNITHANLLNIAALQFITLIAENGTVGTEQLPLRLARIGGGNWTSENLKVVGASIFIEDPVNVFSLLTGSFTTNSGGIFGLYQSTGNISYSAEINLPGAVDTLVLSARTGDIIFATNNPITNVNLRLIGSSIRANPGSFVYIGGNKRLELIAVSGSIGSSSTPLLFKLVNANAVLQASNLKLFSATGTYATMESGAHNLLRATHCVGAITPVGSCSASSGILTGNTITPQISITQSSGNFTINNDVSLPMTHVRLVASSGSINFENAFTSQGLVVITSGDITSSATITIMGNKNQLEFTAGGSIGTTKNPINLTFDQAIVDGSNFIRINATNSIFLASESATSFIALLGETSCTQRCLLAGQTVNFIQKTGNFVINNNISASTRSLGFIAIEGAIIFGNQEFRAASFTINAQKGIFSQGGGFNLIANSISLISQAGDIGTSVIPLRVNSASNDFSSFTLTLGTGFKAYLTRDNNAEALAKLLLSQKIPTGGELRVFSNVGGDLTSALVGIRLASIPKRNPKPKTLLPILQLLSSLLSPFRSMCDTSLLGLEKLYC
ncbi:MAG: hypothetical protein QM538_05725, partial [Methylacidiphilales bacterium]|nr:hypothetical protein [Candidatus Methylacidiphilales bacterium]